MYLALYLERICTRGGYGPYLTYLYVSPAYFPARVLPRGGDGGETATGVHGQKALEKAGVGVGRSGVSMRKYARWI